VPLTGDYLLSMPHGPVLSQVLDQINGGGSLGNQKIWDGWINSRAKHKVALDSKKNKPNLADSLLSLSESDLEVLQHVWDTYGAMTQWELRDFTHTKAIPEWQEPHGSSIPIDYETLFEKNGKTKNEAKAIARRLREEAAAAHSITT
jgi:uncharacterized phage-associated protein